MKKSFRNYLIAWIIIFLFFNLIWFIGYSNILNGTQKLTSFWIYYCIIIISFIGQLYCAYIAFKAESINKFFYSVSLINISYYGLILTVFISALCTLITSIPSWIGTIVCISVFAFTYISIIKAKTAVDVIDEIDQKIADETEFIRLLTSDAEHLIQLTETDKDKEICKKIYDAIRYSDPRSTPELDMINQSIRNSFDELYSAIRNGNSDITNLAYQTINLVEERNRKCRALK